MTITPRATLTRGPSTSAGTFGRIQCGDSLTLHTVELPWRDNLTGKSSIPLGTYRCEIVNSPRFGRVYGLRDVPGRSNILIHAANFGGNTELGFDSDLLGCIAPAMTLGALTNRQGITQQAGLRSKEALARLMEWGAGRPFELVIS